MPTPVPTPAPVSTMRPPSTPEVQPTARATALMAPTATVEPTPTVVHPIFGDAMGDPVAAMAPTPDAPRTPPAFSQATRVSGRNCETLCEEEFWRGRPTTVDLQAELDAGADVNARDGDPEHSPLQWAALYSPEYMPDVIRLLLD